MVHVYCQIVLLCCEYGAGNLLVLQILSLQESAKLAISLKKVAEANAVSTKKTTMYCWYTFSNTYTDTT